MFLEALLSALRKSESLGAKSFVSEGPLLSFQRQRKEVRISSVVPPLQLSLVFSKCAAHVFA